MKNGIEQGFRWTPDGKMPGRRVRGRPAVYSANGSTIERLEPMQLTNKKLTATQVYWAMEGDEDIAPDERADILFRADRGTVDQVRNVLRSGVCTRIPGEVEVWIR